MDYVLFVCTNDDEKEKKQPSLEYWIENESKGNNLEWLLNISKDEFIDLTLQKVEIQLKNTGLLNGKVYRFGDLGPIYGTQWRAFGNGIFRKKENDQIQRIIETLKTNPNDRRMLCVAFNPGQLDNMALPPCHVMFQFYTRELSREERLNWLSNTTSGDSDEDWFDTSDEKMDRLGVPKYGLSCMWTQRSVDVCCGLPFNIASYALLTHIIAHLVGMIPDELVGSLGDCHIYKNHIDGVNEQLKRLGSDTLPTLKIKRKVESIEDFKYDDFEILNYSPDPPIKYQLNVG
jgi:thymidylate synthase